MIRTLCFIFMIIGLSFTLRSQEYVLNNYNIDDVISIENKPVILFFSAEWCKYCTLMKSDFSRLNDSTRILQNEFYFIEIDEREKRPIRLNGEEFTYVPRGINVGQHEIVEKYARTDEGIAFPTMVILWKGQVIVQRNSFLSAKDSYVLLKSVLKVIEN